ncbi:(2Fe-2S) ferredoxin domain-containing protein [Argonema antarcticum]|uniref:(2Fe-2S) ferredoxin domain-containing protein n=1 Tax=Argonema antarcticum TaxID=2942763 RepID=UPI002011CDAD|nr:(2Fe-2S) ferredoxin domain-containing protein [Argonema antarcticum]MCL1469268.1 (2Fe-2S) ferredoxin domain-containing protein [Argonema antarcticum A004/B2]
MSKYKSSQISEFRLEGRFLGFVVEDGYKIKRMTLATAEGEFSLKLSKEARVSLSRHQVLIPGVWVEIFGEKKLDQETGEYKIKVDGVLPKTPVEATPALPLVKVTSAEATKPAKAQACILVCQKSDCCKLGAASVSKALEEGLRDRGLEGQVTIKGTGCMKQCKAGPNIVMPDKTRYKRVDPREIPHLIDKHLAKEETLPKETVAELATVR